MSGNRVSSENIVYIDGKTGKPLANDGQCKQTDHHVQCFQVYVRSTGSVSPHGLKQLIQTKFEVLGEPNETMHKIVVR